MYRYLLILVLGISNQVQANNKSVKDWFSVYGVTAKDPIVSLSCPGERNCVLICRHTTGTGKYVIDEISHVKSIRMARSDRFISVYLRISKKIEEQARNGLKEMKTNYISLEGAYETGDVFVNYPANTASCKFSSGLK